MKFKDLINSETPVLIDFFAEWCGPCKAMAPVLDEVARKIGKEGKVIKIDVDKNNELARKLQIRGVPTFMIYKGGKEIWKQSGMQTADVLVKLLADAK